jgi:site-specific DNA recombinase
LDGGIIGGVRFGVGALAHLLQNRFYIGEVVYRGDIHRGGPYAAGSFLHY